MLMLKNLHSFLHSFLHSSELASSKVGISITKQRHAAEISNSTQIQISQQTQCRYDGGISNKEECIFRFVFHAVV